MNETVNQGTAQEVIGMEIGNILVVDDTPQTLRLLTTILSAENYTVRPADSGALALASIQASPPELILLDVKMPEMSGFDVCRQLQQNPKTQAIPVIFLSGLTDLDDRVQGFQLGAVDFIAKPFNPERLYAILLKWLERRSDYSNDRRVQNDGNRRLKYTDDFHLLTQSLAAEYRIELLT